jgi:hypothetical protein
MERRSTDRTNLETSLDETLDRSLERYLVLLEDGFSIHDERIGLLNSSAIYGGWKSGTHLDKDLARELLGKDERTKFLDPLGVGRRQLLVERCSPTSVPLSLRSRKWHSPVAPGPSPILFLT